MRTIERIYPPAIITPIPSTTNTIIIIPQIPWEAMVACGCQHLSLGSLESGVREPTFDLGSMGALHFYLLAVSSQVSR